MKLQKLTFSPQLMRFALPPPMFSDMPVSKQEDQKSTIVRMMMP